MPPSEEACKIILTTQTNIIKILKRIREIRDKITSAIELKANLKFGGTGLIDAIGAEVLAAIGSVAASSAKAMLGAVSGAASTVMEAIMSSILKILLANPTAIFSLISIPHSQAVEAVYKERTLLRQAYQNLRTILRIILKWGKGFGGTRFYNQITEALPYIKEALALSVSLLGELEGYDGDGDVPNARMDEGKYRRMQRNIAKAIEITKPESVIDNQLQITKRVEESRERYYQKKAIEINKKYDGQRNSLHSEYTKDMIRVNNSEDGLAQSIKLEAVRVEYAMKRKLIEAERKIELNTANAEAVARSLVDRNAYKKAIGGLVGSFNDDIQTLGYNLKEFVENISDAFAAHKRSQNLCHSMYRIRTLITNLINEMIDILRRAGNATAEVAIEALENAQAFLILTHEDFTSAVDRFESTSESISSIELSSLVIKGNGLLNSADAIMSSTITDSLIDLINSDDVLQVANDRFEKFYKELEGISDWDGKSTGGVTLWATDPISAAMSPYPQIIADSITILTKIPVLALSSNREEQQKILTIMRDVTRTFRTLFTHNDEVKNVLTSYQPYMSSEGGNLLRILSNAGLVDEFATTLSIASVAANIVVATGDEPFDDTLPTYGACRRNYPNLYSDPDAAEVAALNKANMPGKSINKYVQQRKERTENIMLRLQKYSKETDFNPLFNQSDFRTPSKT